MTSALTLLLAALAGVFVAPLGLVPSIVIFRDLANGNATDASTERRYAIVVWGGVAAAWCVGGLLAAWILTSALVVGAAAS